MLCSAWRGCAVADPCRKLLQFDSKKYYSGDASASCEASAYASAFAASASDQAKLVKGIWEDTCSPLTKASKGELDFDKKAKAFAFAYVSVSSRTHLRIA